MRNNKAGQDECGYSVVLVEYFSNDHIIKCIESIYMQTKLPEKIVIVINGIDPDYKIRIANKFPEIQLIEPNTNLGYAKAANLGISNTQSPLVLTLNPDTLLENDVGHLCSEYFMQHIQVGSLGPQILESNGDIYPSARKEPSLADGIGHALLGTFFPNNRFSKSYKNLEADSGEIRNSDWLSGACLFLRRSALDEIGGWDEDYFMYCEDIDLGRKLRTAGWDNIYFPKVHITHVQGVSTSRSPVKLIWIHHKSFYIFMAKKYGNNFILKTMVAIFIGIRFPLATISHVFRIN